jgi:dihydroorotate dehydrogenase (fumarate)
MMASPLPFSSGAGPQFNTKHLFKINPPLLNSANPWATSYEDLMSLYDCPATGAVTIRTSLLKSFKQNPSTHQYTFFSTTEGHATSEVNVTFPEGRGEVVAGETSSLNTLGYSPIAFEDYMRMLINMSHAGYLTKRPAKPFIVSVTGTAAEVAQCCDRMLKILNEPDEYQWIPGSSYDDLDLMMEINLSCPNIPDKPPPAYDGISLTEYITAISEVKRATPYDYQRPLHVGIKTPPYTYQGQFQTLIESLEMSTMLPGGCPISFITATNTLGSCLVVNAENQPALGSANGSGIGGMAGDALHPIALGNVKTIRGMLEASGFPDLRRIAIIGIGGVSDAAGFKRMRSVGALAVGVGTALGREGVSIFPKIISGLSESDIAR